MSARQLLDQLLQSGQGLARQAAGQAQSLGVGKGSSGGGIGGLSPLLSGALSGGAISMLMGNKGARKYGGKAVKYGGMAALGALAFKAFQQWQNSQGATEPATATGQAPASQPVAALPAPRTMDRIPEVEVEAHSKAVLIAMIGAAKADGHIGETERGLLEGELGRLGEAQDRPWVQAELARPLDPAQVASHAQTPEMAAEMYLASLLMVDDESFMERAYLDELARRLNLAPDLKSTLEAQVKTV